MDYYYSFLQQAYKIICNKLRDTKANTKMSLQIVIKTINDSVGLDGIIPILLVFGAYPRISNNSLLSLTTTKKAKTIRKTNNKITKYYTK
jgi:hypothetical protein